MLSKTGRPIRPVSAEFHIIVAVCRHAKPVERFIFELFRLIDLGRWERRCS